MENFFSTTTERITTSTSSFIQNIIIEPQEITLTQPPEAFFDKQWVVALIGAIVGIALSELISWFRDARRTNAKRKNVAQGFFTDIIANRTSNNKSLNSVNRFLTKFQTMAEVNNFTSHPLIQYTERDLLRYYNSSLSDLGLFDRSVNLAIYTFYTYVDSVIASTKLLEERTKLFYKGDSTICAQDVINTTTKKLEQMKLVDISGVVAIALLINKYRVDTEKKSKELIEEKTRIKSVLDQIEQGQKIHIKSIADQCNANLLFTTVVITARKDYKDVGLGEYEKLSR